MAALDRLFGLLVKAGQPFYRMTRGLTLGVRVAVFSETGQVLLVRHTYTPGWFLPGGGVDTRETLRQAAIRELREEAGVIAEEAPQLHGMFLNEEAFAGNHVACFIVRKFRQFERPPSFEIAEKRFCSIGDLPEETTSGTRRRIEEILTGSEPTEEW
jgi:8-oxo-dGTP pyrophosphatase MutT (NUDIX family)